MRTRNVLLLALGAALIVPVSASAAVIGHWQFEDSPGYLADSGGAGRTLTTPSAGASPTQVTLPAVGPGSAFVTGVPGTVKAASFDGGDLFQRADEAAFADSTFSAEALINGSNFSTLSAQKSIVGQWNSTGNQRSWLLAVNGSGASAVLNLLFSTDGVAAVTVSSGLPALAQGNDYYVGVTVNMADTSANGITFYQQDLTAGGPLLIAGVAHAGTALFDSSTALTIGSTNQPSSPFTGLIDEVRYSDVKLTSSELLVPIPEPTTVGLLAVAGLVTLARRRR